MFISHKHKIAHVAVPKTGSTSLHYGLISHLDVKFKLKEGAPHLYHLNALDIARIMGPGKFASFFSFGVVRNPYDRMVSLYHDFHDQRGAIKADQFDQFVLEEFEARWKSNVHFRPQCFFLCRGTELAVSTFYRFEQGMESILATLGERFAFEPREIGHSRKSERKAWQEYYGDPNVVAKINETYAVDFDTFGYDQLPHESEKNS